MISAAENTRLDALTAYCATILAHLTGEALDAALVGEAKRYGQTDASFRTRALENTHPDDLVTCLATKGLTLAKFGIDSIAVSA